MTSSAPSAPRPIVIIGAGGHGRETLDIVRAINAEAPRWHFAGFVSDRADAARLAAIDAPFLGALDHVVDAHPEVSYVIGIGDGAVRQRLDLQLRDLAPGWEAVTLIHPSATVGADVRLAAGVVLAAGARVTTNVALGRHTQLNVQAVVSHDCTAGDYVTFSPGVLVNGTNTIGDLAFFGTGAVVTPGHTIGEAAVIGAGAVVVSDVAAHTTVKGVPAC